VDTIKSIRLIQSKEKYRSTKRSYKTKRYKILKIRSQIPAKATQQNHPHSRTNPVCFLVDNPSLKHHTRSISNLSQVRNEIGSP